MMKIKLFIAIVAVALIAACDRDEYEAPNSFSDVSWYTSGFRNDTIRLNAEEYASFADLSQGATSHKWTIEEGSFFLKGPITRRDSVYDSFIINPGSLETTDKTAHVLFKEGGIKKVNLFNEFDEFVQFEGANDFIFEAKEIGGKWIIDTTFIVDVYDTIVAQVLVRQNGELLPHESDTDVITIEAGSTLEFEDVTSIGRPNTTSWRLNGNIVSSDPVTSIQFNSLGTSRVLLVSSRTGENTPGDADRYLIPARFNVVPSSLPFEITGGINELEDQTIQIPLNGELAPFADQRPFFTVNVNGNPFTISTIRSNPANATILDIELTEQIYKDDVITVSYDGTGGIESTDTRVLGAFTDTPVAMFQHELIVLDIEEDAPNWMPHVSNLATTTISTSTEQAASESTSLKIEAAEAGDWSAFQNETNQFRIENGQEIQYEFKVFIASGAEIPFIGPWIVRPGAALVNVQQFFVTLNGVSPGVWTTIKPAKKYIYDGATNDDFFLYLRHRGSGTIYFDDIKILEVDERP